MDTRCFSLSHFMSLCSLGDPEIVQFAVMKDISVPLVFGGAKNLDEALSEDPGDQPMRESFLI